MLSKLTRKKKKKTGLTNEMNCLNPQKCPPIELMWSIIRDDMLIAGVGAVIRCHICAYSLPGLIYDAISINNETHSGDEPHLYA